MNEFKQMREAAGMSMDEVVPKMRLLYPRFSKPALSYAEAPEESGLTLTETAAANFKRITGNSAAKPTESPQTKRPENRANPHRWQVRLNTAQSELLNRRMARLGITSKQTYLETVLLKEIKKEARYEADSRCAGCGASVADGR